MMRGEETRKVKEELGIASPPITKPRLEFTNFNQFVQKVEVYRGR